MIKTEVDHGNKDYTFTMDLTLESYSRSNQPIEVSENIDPAEAIIDQEIIISGQAVDSNSDPIQNGDIIIEIQKIGEIWTTNTDDNGFYLLSIEAPFIPDDTPSDGEFGSDGVIVRCSSGNLDGYRVKTLLIIDDFPPYPPTIDGQTSGNAGTEYEYTFNAVDPDSDNVKYHIDWDDGDSDTTAFSSSGTNVKVKHTWSTQGTYIIKAKAEDTNGLESDWAELSVSMPRNRATQRPFLNSLQNFLQQYPILYQLLLRFLRL
jgi:hypothetical protein